MPHITIVGTSKNMMIKELKIYAGIQFKNCDNPKENDTIVLEILQQRLTEAMKIFIDEAEAIQWSDTEMEQKLYWEKHFKNQQSPF